MNDLPAVMVIAGCLHSGDIIMIQCLLPLLYWVAGGQNGKIFLVQGGEKGGGGLFLT
jgi:hypothetical protein